MKRFRFISVIRRTEIDEAWQRYPVRMIALVRYKNLKCRFFSNKKIIDRIDDGRFAMQEFWGWK